MRLTDRIGAADRVPRHRMLRTPATPTATAGRPGDARRFPTRDGSWAVVLAHAGHIVLLPDSFGSRGLGSQCSVTQRGVTPSKVRRGDAIAAVLWLTHRPGTPPGDVALVGWSNGGGTVLYTANQGRGLPPGLFRRFVAFYPDCATEARDPDRQPSAPLLIWWAKATTGLPRHRATISQRGSPDGSSSSPTPAPIAISMRRAVRSQSGRAWQRPPAAPATHTGTNEPARLDALQRVPEYLAAGR